MKALTPDEIHKLERQVLESYFMRLQALASAQKNRQTITRQRLCLIEQHVVALKKHITASMGEGE